MSTPSERYLTELGRKAFLKLWSYQSPFRDQGKSTPSADGKELCDLLVVFGDEAIVFSDKWCAFPNSGDVDLDWRRWKTRAVDASIKQVDGAERWLRRFPNRIFQDRKCEVPLFVPVSHSEKLQVHRIVVAHDSTQRCRSELQGSGSCMLASFGYVGQTSVEGRSFTIVSAHEPGHFTHVFDDVSLDYVLMHLDTIEDFLAYLRMRERLLGSSTRVQVAGEEELLGFYLRSYFDTGVTDLPEELYGDHETAIVLGEGLWHEFTETEEYRHWHERIRISYFWDGLIDKFTDCSLQGSFQFSTHPSPTDQARVLKLLAGEHRIARTVLSTALLTFVGTAPAAFLNARTMVSPTNPAVAYVFITRPNSPDLSDSENRGNRIADLSDYCLAIKHKMPSVKYIVGIATEPRVEDLRTEDMLLIDATIWSRAAAREAADVVKKRGFTTQTKEQWLGFYHADPYAQAFRGTVKIGRNDSCPCGSGKKYKHCCLRVGN